MRKKQMKSDNVKSNFRASIIQSHPNEAPQKSAPLQPPASITSGEIHPSGGVANRMSIENLEKYRDFAAFVVVEHGSQYGFVLERLERMLARAKENDVMERARKILAEADLKKLSTTKLKRR